MADDVAQRLRSRMDADELELEAADEIERLRAEVDRLTLERDDLDVIRNRENDEGSRYIAKLATERNGLREQHGRDSAELRRLCAERDEIRQQRDDLRERLEKAPVCELSQGMCVGQDWAYAYLDGNGVPSLIGHRVRLVREEDT